MAKKKKSASLPVFKQPMDLAEAQEALKNEIAAGKKILDQQPTSEALFKATQQQMNSWDSHTMNTLAAVTDDDSLTKRYTEDDPPPAGFLGHDFDLKEELNDLRTYVQNRVAKLEAILADLPKILE